MVLTLHYPVQKNATHVNCRTKRLALHAYSHCSSLEVHVLKNVLVQHFKTLKNLYANFVKIQIVLRVNHQLMSAKFATQIQHYPKTTHV